MTDEIEHAAKKINPSPLPVSEEFFAVARITGPWGVRGDVKVELLTDNPQRFASHGVVYMEGRRLEVQRSRVIGGRTVLKLADIETRDQAEQLRGRLLEVPESELMPLEPGQYYEHQILGLAVETTAGRVLGRVDEILHTGSNDVYIVRQDRREYLIPAIADVIRDIDLASGRIIIEPLPGLLD